MGNYKIFYNREIKSKKKMIIGSYKYRKNLIDFACNLSNYLTSNYKIKYIKEIKPKHIISFVKEKEIKSNNGKGCSHATLIQYRSYINKLDKLIKQTYKFNSHLVDRVPAKLGGNANVRNLYLKPEHVDLLLQEKSKSVSDAVLGIKINSLFALRAEEITKLKAKDIDLIEMKLHIIDGKNGKSRDL